VRALRLAVFFPSKSKDNIPKKTFDDAKEFLEEKLAHSFGGLTEYQEGNGLWISEDGSLVKEAVTVLEIYADDIFKSRKWKELVRYLAFLREVLHQESFAFACDNKIYFVSRHVLEDGTECSEFKISVSEEDYMMSETWIKFRDAWNRKFSNRE
jgi:hypothetical protein